MCFDLWVRYVTSERDLQSVVAFSAGVGAAVAAAAIGALLWGAAELFRQWRRARLMAELHRDLGVH